MLASSVLSKRLLKARIHCRVMINDPLILATKIATNQLQKIGNNWQLKSPSVPYRAIQYEVQEVHFDQAGVENINYAEEN